MPRMPPSPRDRQARARIGGTVAGRYDLTGLLGVGGMGAVYRARHRVTGHEVALKLLFPDVVHHPEAVTRFLREAGAAARIKHPGVVLVLDAEMDEGATEVYLVMELLEGEDLSAVFARGNLPLERMIDIVIELLEGLGAVHGSGFVHRDVKPANVFLALGGDGSTRVKLLDFGVARCLEPSDPHHTATGTLLGTPSYMAPEQAMGRPVDARADLWSVGALMFRAFVGRPPFDGENSNMVIAAIIFQPTPPLAELRPDLPADLVRFVDRALSKDPDGRWPDAAAAQGALRAIRRDMTELSGTTFPTVPELETPMDWRVPSIGPAPRRVPSAMLVLALVVALGAALLAGLATSAPPPRPVAVHWTSPAPPASAIPTVVMGTAAVGAALPVVPIQQTLAPPPVAPAPLTPITPVGAAIDSRPSRTTPPRRSRSPSAPASTAPRPPLRRDPHLASDSL